MTGHKHRQLLVISIRLITIDFMRVSVWYLHLCLKKLDPKHLRETYMPHTFHLILILLDLPNGVSQYYVFRSKPVVSS